MIEEAYAMVQQRMLKIITSKETSQIAMVTRSKQNKLGKSEQHEAGKISGIKTGNV
jgi:hypothetical protein